MRMDRLRPRQRPPFSGFTRAEVEKMEKMLEESEEQVLEKEFCQNITKRFNRCVDRAGKPVLKWTEIHSWFKNRWQESTSKNASSTIVSKNECELPENGDQEMESWSSELLRDAGGKLLDLKALEFEARSSRDGAWYDVDLFLTYRFACSDEPEVLVRYVGFGPEEDEWVNIKKQVRLRSIPLENSECHRVKIGDLVLCFQEKGDEANHYDAHVIEIQRRMHDIRGCRCLFLIRYDHDNTEERVRLRSLCRRPC